ncbi:hypothetical protein E2542_SST13844 [Spatholobus suberectus]|nr:hypothetical protein E2542_SST13844 [Spatholobus suberectus]
MSAPSCALNGSVSCFLSFSVYYLVLCQTIFYYCDTSYLNFAIFACTSFYPSCLSCISAFYSAEMNYTLQNKIFSCRQFRSLRIMGLLLAAHGKTCLLNDVLCMMTILEKVIVRHGEL